MSDIELELVVDLVLASCCPEATCPQGAEEEGDLLRFSSEAFNLLFSEGKSVVESGRNKFDGLFLFFPCINAFSHRCTSEYFCL